MSEAPSPPFGRLHLQNVRCFRDTTIELHPKLTVLIGENGTGKTTIAEALASLSYGETEGLVDFPVSRGFRSGKIALFPATAGGSAKSGAHWQAGARGKRLRLPESRHLFAYGRYRRVYYPDEAGGEEAVPRRSNPSLDLEDLVRHVGLRRTDTLFRPDNHLLRDLSRYLGALHFAQKIDPSKRKIWDQLNHSLGKLGHGIEGIEMDPETEVPQVLRNGFRLELRELSDGYQALLVVVFDLILRLAYLHPGQDEPLHGAAVVVIDEVDLHLHPRWQRTVCHQLTALFPGVQWILTTHSPAVVQGAIDEEFGVIALQEKPQSKEVVARALGPRETKALTGAEIGSILAEEKLFGVDSRYSPEYAAIEVRVEKLKKKIQRGTATEEERTQLLEDLETLNGLVVQDERRRADGSFLQQIGELRIAFLRDLAAEIERAKR